MSDKERPRAPAREKPTGTSADPTQEKPARSRRICSDGSLAPSSQILPESGQGVLNRSVRH
jgi:hypothetical protein